MSLSCRIFDFKDISSAEQGLLACVKALQCSEVARLAVSIEASDPMKSFTCGFYSQSNYFNIH